MSADSSGTKIISNLLSNALRFAAEEIHICIDRRDDGLVMEVWDDGPGIPAEEREKVFEAFYQTRNNGFASGVGIGLHLCRIFIRLMGRNNYGDRTSGRQIRSAADGIHP